MSDFPRPAVIVSKCLGFDHCRYNGEIVDDPFVRRLREFCDVVVFENEGDSP